MKLLLLFGLLALLGVLAALLYATLPTSEIRGTVIGRRQRVEREDPTFGYHGSFLGVLYPVFELCVRPEEGGEPLWLPCTQTAYHRALVDVSCRLHIRGELICGVTT